MTLRQEPDLEKRLMLMANLSRAAWSTGRSKGNDKITNNQTILTNRARTVKTL
jgi:hypothetical protein